MKDYIKLIKNEKEGSVSVRFEIKQDKIAAIGEKIKAINGAAAMTGSNWEALLEFYLDEKHPEISGGMGANSTPTTYKAYYKLTPANEKRAEKLAEIIEGLIENESKLYDLVKNNADDIEWD